VINGLTDWLHPCQILADLFTLYERGMDLDRIVVTYIGDGNNVANSWIEAAGLYGLTIRIACPEGYDPDRNLIAQVESAGRGRVEIHRDPLAAAKDANVLYTDVWASMGQEAEREKRIPIFRGYQINAEALAHAAKNAVVLHCLPAHRGEEITEDVIEGPQSAVFDEAENRLHLQKAILFELMAADAGRETASRAKTARAKAARGKPARAKTAPRKKASRAPRRGRTGTRRAR